MNKRELIERELQDLDSLSDKFVRRVESTLKSIRKEDVHLFLTQKDRYRLLILRSWEIKYRIPLRYILSTVLPIWEAFVKRRSKKMKSQGLNVRVSTLTGKKSEQYLVERINKDFPGELNKIMYISSERERIFNKTLHQVDDGIKVKSNIKDLQDFISTTRYVKYYRKERKKENKRRDTIQEEFEERPYRGNPFKEETKR